MNEREILEHYNLRVLRTVAKRFLPKPVFDRGQGCTERHKLRRHYYDFLYRGRKEELIGALLPYMNSNAMQVLEETAIWVELHPIERRKYGGTEASQRSHARYQHDVESPRRKATREYMSLHPEVVEQLKLKLKEEVNVTTTTRREASKS